MRGLWFYGLAGVGKTTAAEYYASTISNGFVIDGDMVRRYISTDLGYTQADREIQVRRILGFVQIVLSNASVPIATTVFMDEETYQKATKLGVRVIEITRDIKALKKIRDIYNSGEDNVVGKTISQSDLNTETIPNCGTEKFLQKISIL